MIDTSFHHEQGISSINQSDSSTSVPVSALTASLRDWWSFGCHEKHCQTLALSLPSNQRKCFRLVRRSFLSNVERQRQWENTQLRTSLNYSWLAETSRNDIEQLWSRSCVIDCTAWRNIPWNVLTESSDQRDIVCHPTKNLFIPKQRLSFDTTRRSSSKNIRSSVNWFLNWFRKEEREWRSIDRVADQSVRKNRFLSSKCPRRKESPPFFFLVMQSLSLEFRVWIEWK